MNLHQEHHFEREICAHLAANGWFHVEGDAAHYDRQHGLFLPDLLAWVEATQPDSWQRLLKTHGPQLGERLAERIRKNLDERGTLDVLRRGVEMLGLKQPLSLVQFKPALAMNPVTQQHYAANRLRVVRQVKHSPNRPNDCVDLVLFVNGIAVATAELKSDFTQSVGDAVDQYRLDRHPRPKGGLREPLLAFPGGALVHFAVSQAEVMMTTRLAGEATRFLPFNRGNAGGAGNAPDRAGFATPYLLEEVWARDSWPEILGRYLIGKRDEKKQLQAVIFPRYHQLGVHPEAGGGRARARRGTALPDPAFGRVVEDQLHRVDGALPRRPAPRQQEGVRQRAGGVRPQRSGQPVAGGDLRLRAHHPGWWPPSPATAAARARSWGRR